MGPLAFALVNNPLAPLTIPLSQILFMKMMVVMKTAFSSWLGKGKQKQGWGVELMTVNLCYLLLHQNRCGM